MSEKKFHLTRHLGQSSTASIAAQNTFTTGVKLYGPFNFSLSGTFVGTITIQRSFDNGTTWRDVATYSSPIETAGDEPESGVLYQAGFKTGAYTSGTAVVRLSQ